MKLLESPVDIQPLRPRSETCSRTIVAPFVVERMLHGSAAHGIQNDIPDELQQVRLAFDENAGESPLKEMPDTVVAPVEVPRP